MGLRILFSVRKPSNVRQFESVLRALAGRGHNVMLVREALGEFDWPPFVLALAESCPGIRLETMPSAAKTHWWELATRFRRALFFLVALAFLVFYVLPCLRQSWRHALVAAVVTATPAA